ncbi:uncharacterized protein LOC134334297 isoform X2 [Trichomycterus rosablanca]
MYTLLLLYFTCDGISQKNGYKYNVLSNISSESLLKCENRWYAQNGTCIADWSSSLPISNSSVIEVKPGFLIIKECLNRLNHVLICVDSTNGQTTTLNHTYNVSPISTPSPPGTSIFTNCTSNPPGTSNNSFWFLLFLLLLIPIAAGVFYWLKKCRYQQTVCRRPDGRRENRNGIAPQQSDPQPNGTTPLPNNNAAAIPKPDERTNNRNADTVKITMSDLLQNGGAPLLDTRAATNRDPDDVEMNGNVNGKINPSDNQHKEETQVLNNQTAAGEE